MADLLEKKALVALAGLLGMWDWYALIVESDAHRLGAEPAPTPAKMFLPLGENPWRLALGGTLVWCGFSAGSAPTTGPRQER